MKQMIKRMTRVLPVVMLALIVGVSVPIAYAGTIDGGNGSYDNSGYGENNTAILDWTYGVYSTYADRYVAGLNLWNRYNTSHYYLSNSDFNEYTRAYACTDFSVWGNSLVGTYILSNGGSYSQSSSLAQQDGTNTGRSWGTRGNWRNQGMSFLLSISSDLVDSSLINDDTIEEVNGVLWSTKYNKKQ